MALFKYPFESLNLFTNELNWDPQVHDFWERALKNPWNVLSNLELPELFNYINTTSLDKF